MPRFNDVETITFTNFYGKQYAVKDIRPISVQIMACEINTRQSDLIDEIASRKDIFGDFGELQSWRIFDLNVVKLAEANFSMSRLRKIKIPV